MTAKGGRTVWTVAVALQWAGALALLFIDASTPNKVLAFAAFALVVNGVAWMVARNSGVRPPWEVLLSAVFQDKTVDVAEEMSLGWKAFDAKDYEAAVGHFDLVLQSEPTRPDALYARGHAHRQLGRDDAALSDYNRALHMRPDLVSARQARAALYLERPRRRHRRLRRRSAAGRTRRRSAPPARYRLRAPR
jgi:tetratricopeptide (TPR) repeat protein